MRPNDRSEKKLKIKKFNNRYDNYTALNNNSEMGRLEILIFYNYFKKFKKMGLVTSAVGNKNAKISVKKRWNKM